MASITIDGQVVEAKEGERLIDVCDRYGIYIPRFCYHPSLSVAGNCRMCLVEIEKVPKLQISCNTAVQDGMVVYTQSEKVIEARRDVLEFIFINHPLDCPICDQAGECKLQDYYMEVGRYKSRFPKDMKVKKPRKAVRWGSGIVFDAERCVLCTICIRFMDEVVGRHSIGVVNRGDRSEIELHDNEKIDTFYAGNLFDICPVGALTSEDFRFKMRVWYLSRTESICPKCSRGCNITVWHKDKTIYRYTPRRNDAVNHAWMCDIGRYSYKSENANGRVLKGWFLRGSERAEKSTSEVLDCLSCKLLEIGAKENSERIACMIMPDRTNEEIYSIYEFMSKVIGSEKVVLDVPAPKGPKDNFLLTGEMAPNIDGLRLFLEHVPVSYGIKDLQTDLKDRMLDALFFFGDLADGLESIWREFLQDVASVKLFAYFGSKEINVAKKAHFVIPSSSFVQKDGTWINAGGTVQRIRKAYTETRHVWPDYSSVVYLADKLKKPLILGNVQDIFKTFIENIAGLPGKGIFDVGVQGLHIKGLPKPENI